MRLHLTGTSTGNNEAPRTGLRLERVLPKFGAGKGTRTLDPDLGKVVLYQLSYSRSNTCALRADKHTEKRTEKMASPRGVEPLLPP